LAVAAVSSILASGCAWKANDKAEKICADANPPAGADAAAILAACNTASAGATLVDPTAVCTVKDSKCIATEKK
jgi:hypothetical protein